VRAIRAFRSENPLYIVIYDANGATAGDVPIIDPMHYEPLEEAPVAGQGTLGRNADGFEWLFVGWNTESDGSGTSYAALSTIAIPSANVTLYAQWTAIGATGPAGGIVFHDKGNDSDGWRYLEAWTADEGAPSYYKWKTSQTSTTGTSTAIGAGYANTYAAMTGTEHPAAAICRDATHGGYTDWFLPSKDELNLMYGQQGVIGGFATHSYWSSSEYDAVYAWEQHFPSGSQYDQDKVSIQNVRAIRAFRSENPLYIVIYDANGATSGTVPVDYCFYESG